MIKDRVTGKTPCIRKIFNFGLVGVQIINKVYTILGGTSNYHFYINELHFS